MSSCDWQARSTSTTQRRSAPRWRRSPARTPHASSDLGEVEFVDSTALGTLIEARKQLANGRLVLAAPGRDVRRALEVSGLLEHFDVHDSVDAALAS